MAQFKAHNGMEYLLSDKGQTLTTDIAIIGAGPVGIFTSFEAGMLGMESILIDVLEMPGGQCMSLYPQKPIYDIPAFVSITGEELTHQLLNQAQAFKPKYLMNSLVNAINRISNNELEVLTNNGTKVKSKAVIIAAGSGAFEPNRPPIENLAEFEGKSIFYAVHNKEIFTNKNIAIAGGGDSALDWCIELAKTAKTIYLIHRRMQFRAADSTLKKLDSLIDSGKVKLIAPFQLSKIEGEKGLLEKIIVQDLDGNQKEIIADYLLPFFGLKMNIEPIAQIGIELEKGLVNVDPTNMQTTIKSVFAVGDVCHYPGKLKLILTGFAEAALACHSAYKFVFPDKALHFEHSTTKGIPEV